MTSKNEELDAVVNVRLTTAERDNLRDAARLAGLTLSALVRRRALGRRVLEDTNMMMVRELRAIGARLAAFEEVHDRDHWRDVQPLLAEIGNAIDKAAK